MSTKTHKVSLNLLHDCEVRRQVETWLERYDGVYTHFITLTFDASHIDAYINRSGKMRDRHDPHLLEMYQRSMRHFLARFQKKLYGNLARRGRSPLIFIPVIEGLKCGAVPHFHCFASIHSDRHEGLESIIKACWKKVQFAGYEINVQTYRDRGCLSYGAKDAVSVHRASVDWMNVQMPTRSHSLAE